MGTLTLPPSGTVYLDTQVVIYSVETHPDYWGLLQPLWQTAQAGNLKLVSSELTLMETLVGPLKAGDKVLEMAYEQLFQTPEVHLLPVTRAVLREAAQLRATIPGLRTPDALHAATGLLNGCGAFLTNDTIFRQLPALLPIVLRDLLVP